VVGVYRRRARRVRHRQIDKSNSWLKLWLENEVATIFVYDTTTATYDPSGIVAQYNGVEVIPGSSDGISKPFGATENYFFNGLSNIELEVDYPYPSGEHRDKNSCGAVTKKM
jgi:hypothetical protein